MAPRALLTLLLPVTGAAAAATRHDAVQPLLIRVGDPASSDDGLADAAARVAAALAAGSADVVVELASGAHRVPAGGLRLTSGHTPAVRMRRSQSRWRHRCS
jgi:hypothetical protein